MTVPPDVALGHGLPGLVITVLSVGDGCETAVLVSVCHGALR